MDDHETEVKWLAMTMLMFVLIKRDPEIAKDAIQMLRGMTRFRPPMPGATDLSVVVEAIEFLESLIQISN